MTDDALTIRRNVEIDRRRDEVFTLYTQRAALWWPFAFASHRGDLAVDLTFEPVVGGRVYETCRDGSQVTWGNVLVWDPPVSFVYSYRPFSDTDDRLTEVEVRFEPLAPTRTRVSVEHRGWEQHGEAGKQRSAAYDKGWRDILGHLAEARSDKPLHTSSATRRDDDDDSTN